MVFCGLPRQGPGSQKRYLQAGLSWLVFLATCLLSARCVFLLPWLWLISMLAGPNSNRRMWPFLLFQGFLAAFALGFLLTQLKFPGSRYNDYSGQLGSVLGARWLPNGLWLLIVMSLGLVWPPEFLKRPAFTGAFPLSANKVLLLLAGVLVLWAGAYRFLVPGQEIFGRYLLWTTLPLVAAVGVTAAITRGQRLAPVFLVLALGAVLVAWRMAPTPVYPAGNDFSRLLAEVGGQDFLFMDHRAVQDLGALVPLPLAAGGRAQSFTDLDGLRTRLRRGPLPGEGKTTWILLPEGTSKSWLIPRSDSLGNPLGLNLAGESWRLFALDQKKLPHQQIIFSKDLSESQSASIRGLLDNKTWTGPVFEMVFDLVSDDAQVLDIYLMGWRPRAAGPLEQGLAVTLNGQRLALDRVQQTHLSFRIPPATLLLGANSLVIHTPTYVPAQVMAGSVDRRVLGLDLSRMIIR